MIWEYMHRLVSLIFDMILTQFLPEPSGGVSREKKKKKSTTAVARGWSVLPAETRLQILEEVTSLDDDILRYATVSREWQFFMEARKFSHIRFSDQGQLCEVAEKLVDHQKQHIRYIWLNIELQEYDCWDCWDKESVLEVRGNNRIIREAVEALYAILSRWEPTPRGLTLELSIQSPSDSRHWFPHWYYGGRESVPDKICMSPAVLRLPPKPHTRSIPEMWSKAVDEMALSRIWDEQGNLFSHKGLPTVSAVTAFVVRRQSRRHLPADDLKLLLEKLCRLESVTFEPWTSWEIDRWVNCDIESIRFVREASLPNLRRIAVFQDFNEHYTRHLLIKDNKPWAASLSVPLPTQPEEEEWRTELFAKGAAARTSLEHLSLSFITDGRIFLRCCEESWTWHNLRFLSLTSTLLRRDIDAKPVTELLTSAASAAKNMPQLRRMILWNARQGECCSFDYRRSERAIHWTAMWDLPLRRDVLRAWDEVIGRAYHSCVTVEIVRHVLRDKELHTHADGIAMLDLPPGIIDPVSLVQIQNESVWDRRIYPLNREPAWW